MDFKSFVCIPLNCLPICSLHLLITVYSFWYSLKENTLFQPQNEMDRQLFLDVLDMSLNIVLSWKMVV